MKRLLVCLALCANTAAAQAVEDAPGAKLRLLDKITGALTDMDLSNGQSQTVGRLTVQMDACRYDPENPAAEAFAHLTVLDSAKPNPVFNGWMTASSPALSALDHPRYDVWVLRCDVPDVVLPEVDETPVEEAPAEDATTDDGNG
ncbi:MAG: hypothetical protein ACD_54C01146G0002 [uncultured bacterium]|uniref:DUF2155 domain-containing protein n=1 Tax=Cypionkella sp. TaxID=2811411 RepID=UPI0002859E50|nr:DUF2155 domain-containing protein [Cypionkella sp.]EKD59774.1 MAG: hypothetical protein ACD_54C01146G0002 [uncultured bacterium]KAF0172618.1 MAG: hypothetical protein FD162_2208 [Paracoccaceae bacterium]MDO8325949.1 DUF2155 domain-containing protein [Cypionkella sp.]